MATAAEARTLQNYIAGRWRDAEVSEALEDRDPATGELAARVPLSGAADVDEAVRAAREAQPAWREVPPQERARAVLALRDALVSHRQEITALVTADMGKTLADADGEVGLRRASEPSSRFLIRSHFSRSLGGPVRTRA